MRTWLLTLSCCLALTSTGCSGDDDGGKGKGKDDADLADTFCDEWKDAQEALAGKTEDCGSLPREPQPESVCDDLLDQCSPSDLEKLETLLDCYSGLPSCQAGKELEWAETAVDECGSMPTLSDTCQRVLDRNGNGPVPSGCTGCVSASGTCEPGTRITACGGGGTTCQECEPGETCTEGQCVNPNACPNGCFGASGCVPVAAQTASQCGNGGNLCKACPAGQTCQQGVCTATGNGTCNASTCPNGCCSAAGLCLAGTSTTACGVGGSACQACPNNQSCNGGTCTATPPPPPPPPPPTGVGAACATDAQCSAVGAGATCRKATAAGNGSYSAGYCSRKCAAASDCPQGSQCSNFSEWGEDLICLDSCSANDPCRAGYGCVAGLCWLDPLPTPPTGPVNVVGNACAQDAQCNAGGTWPAGFCAPAPNFPGGACIAECSVLKQCPSDARCVLADDNGTANPNDDFSICMERCSNAGAGQGTCRAGYTCVALSLNADGTPAPDGICSTRCTSNDECPSSHGTCNLTTGNCCNAANVCI